MFLLIPAFACSSSSGSFTLHSTMFLLIHIAPNVPTYCFATLHSTMFLLIPGKFLGRMSRKETLHSTMFLLIRTIVQQTLFVWNNFTFHNVSINTYDSVSYIRYFSLFTFHNVSINTRPPIPPKPPEPHFTFHNVSINTLIFVICRIG